MPTPERKREAATLLTVGFHGRELCDPLRRLLDCGVSGVVLFSRNIGTSHEVAQLIRSIKEYAGRPLYIGVDQEGGVVQRLRDGFTRIPPMRALGTIDDTVLVERLGRLVGKELRAVGVDVNYAPVLDVDTNPNNPVIGSRSFSRDPEVVGRLGVAFGRGLQAMGVAACGKHFPGHGDTAQDSHCDLPRLSHTMERLRAVELVPFRAFAEAELASVMTAHVLFEAVDSEHPATMSQEVLTGVLRQEIGYQGLVVSDDLEMKAIADHYGQEQAAILGVNAGVDNFLCCHTEDVAHSFIDTVARAAHEGVILQRRFVEAQGRMARFLDDWARPASSAAALLEAPGEDDSYDASELLEEIVRRADPSSLGTGRDPTEAMKHILEERMQKQAQQ